MQSNRKVWARIRRAATAVVENLERRQLMAGDPALVQSLPFALDFDGPRAGTLADKDGEATGFTWVQPNKNGNEYQASLIDLDVAAGLLNLTTSGTSALGSNWEGDNTLVNGLQTAFDARGGSFTITARIKGSPNLGFIDKASEQGGIIFGPDQDNYVKLVAMAQSTGPFLQFVDEQSGSTAGTFVHQLNGSASMTSVGSFANIQTLDLAIAGDAATGKLTAYYRINGGSLTKLTQEITLSGAKKDAFFAAAAKAGVIAMHKNDLGPITVGFDQFQIVSGTPVVNRPTVTATRPANGERGVARDGFIAADLRLPTPGHGVDAGTLTALTVKLYRTSDRAAVPANLNTSGGGDAIVLQPTVLLDANTSYTFEVTDGLKDTGGEAFVPYTMSFTTGDAVTPTDPQIAFEKVSLPTATGFQYTGLTVGPDGKLYAGTSTGLIHRFTIAPDGTLSAPDVINVVQTANGGPRLITGMRFDPASTADNLILWISHGQSVLENAQDWTGKVSRLSGANLQGYQDYVVSLPRSVRDHLTNQIDFGPDGALYFSQASNTAMGAADNAWGLRSEHLLNAAILRLDTGAVAARIAAGQGALNVKTEEGGTYNPFAAGAPLTIYATGVRNAYDLVWTRDGRLYAPTNGSAAGGSTPAYAGGTFGGTRIDQDVNGPFTSPPVKGLTDVSQTEDDFLFRIDRGGYYGHPNPTRGEFVQDGGNPTSGADYEEFTAYPVGTQPDRNYRGAAYIFGKNYSPDGIIEYKGNAFGGRLDGKLLVTRYSGGDDVIVLTPGADGNIAAAQTGIAGLTGFKDPLDLALDPRTGFVYLSEYGASKLTLLRPITPGGNITTDKAQLVFNDVRTDGAGTTVKVRVGNNGTQPLAFPADGLTITGVNASMFTFVGKPTLPLTIPVGGFIDLTISFKATSTSTIDVKTASLVIKSNDPDQPVTTIALRGLPTLGTGGANEPSLQQVFDLYNLPINVGDANPSNTNLFSNVEPLTLPNDEVTVQRLIKAGAGPVTIEPLAVFGLAATPTARFGWYQAGTLQSKKELFIVPSASAQTVNPTVSGTLSFDPGSTTFGLWTAWPATLFNNPDGTQHEVYSEDVFNTYEQTEANRRKFRFYPLKNADGSVVPDAYVVTQDDFQNDANGAYDFQDLVAIIRNVRAMPNGPELGIENLDGLPSFDRLIFNRIQRQPPDTKTDPVTGEIIQPPNNKVHDTATVRLRNTGNAPLTIGGLTLSSPAWQIVNMPAAGTQIAANGFLDVTVKFVATSIPAGQKDNQTVGAALNTGGVWNGTLTIQTDDADEPGTTVQLAGWWQDRSEWNQEPALPVLVNRIYGYTTQILNPGEQLAQGGRNSAVGEEVLSAYWTRADATLPVHVRQLAAYHTQGNTEWFRSFVKGATTSSTVFTHDGVEGQSMLPHDVLDPTKWAEGNVLASHVSGTSIFGFRVQSSYSDDSRNQQQQNGGHQLRFFPVRDAEGNVVPNTYLVAHDYFLADATTGAILSNFDYQDNLYIVTNVKPAAPATPTALAAVPAPGGIALDWADNTDALLAGYNVYRSANGTSGFVKLNASGPVTASEFLDTTAAPGATSYYRVTAVDRFGTESGNSVVANATRSSDVTPPAAPTGLTADGQQSGVVLSWTANSTDGDVAGYRVYRSDALDGTYLPINNGQLVTFNTAIDANALAGPVWYYKVSAVDGAGNESALSDAASATRPAPPDTTPPAVPTGLTAKGQAGGIQLTWKANTDGDLAGYRLYRSTVSGGTYVAVEGGKLMTGTSYLDADTAEGQTWFYRITALDAAGNESAKSASPASAARPDTTPPAPPVGVTAQGRVDGVRIAWSVSGEADFAGYRVYRAAAADGSYVPIDGGQLVTATSFLDEQTQPEQTWFYRVTAVDRTGNESAPSAAVGGSRLPPPDTTAPATPGGLTAGGGYNGIWLRWNAGGDRDLAGYNVYRAPAGTTDFLKLTTGLLPADGPAFDDLAVGAGAAWDYRVTAVDFSGNESAAATAGANRPLPLPPTIAVNGAGHVAEGSVYRLDLGAVNYFGTEPVTRYVVRWGDGTIDTYGDGGVKTHVFADGSAIRDVSVDLGDANANYSGVATVRVAVDDVAPQVAIAGAASADAGAPYRLGLSAIDPGDDTIARWVIDWGDGSVETLDGNPAEALHAYASGGRYAPVATATNEDGSFRSNALAVAVTSRTPGASMAAPIDLGTLQGKGRDKKRSVATTLGGETTELFYRFTIAAPMKVNAVLSGLRANADLELMDATGRVIVHSAQPKARSEKAVQVLPAGSYVLKVAQNGAAGTKFKLALSISTPSKKALIKAKLYDPPPPAHKKRK